MKSKLIFVIVAIAEITAGNLQKTNAQSWVLRGNNNATANSKLGTLNNFPLRIYAKNKERMHIDTSGDVGIGATSPGAKLDLKSTVSGQLARFNGGASLLYMGLYENNVYRGYIGSFSGNNEDVDFGTGS